MPLRGAGGCGTSEFVNTLGSVAVSSVMHNSDSWMP
jgi:hypothetical protein